MGRSDLDGCALDASDLELTARLLEQWVVAHYGRDALVDRVAPMPGHAGISFGFDVTAGSGTQRLVIRTAPPGLRREGPGDVLRQVPVLQCARAHGVPAPEVRWWGDDERWFASPYFIVERLAGGSINSWEPSDVDRGTVARVFEQAVSALVAVHRIDWRTALPRWSVPRSLEDEIRAWAPILHKGKNPEWSDSAMTLHDALLRRRPTEPEPSILHGDFYSNNWVCDGDQLLGVVDWEIAGIGAPLLDLGWLMMVYDRPSWGDGRRALMTWAPDPGWIAEAYAEGCGGRAVDLDWYRALAAWRFASITALNVRLHRTGRRHDPMWEEMAESFEPMVRRGCELLLAT
jgi:aminoglycoside phosphotransferase (APT) family kinase protein